MESARGCLRFRDVEKGKRDLIERMLRRALHHSTEHRGGDTLIHQVISSTRIPPHREENDQIRIVDTILARYLVVVGCCYRAELIMWYRDALSNLAELFSVFTKPP